MDYSRLIELAEAAEANAKFLREKAAQMAEKVEADWPMVGDKVWTFSYAMSKVHDFTWDGDNVVDVTAKGCAAIWRTEAEAQAALAEVQAFLRLRAAGSDGVPAGSDYWVAGITSVEKAPRAVFTGGSVGHCAPQFLRFHTVNDARAFVERNIDDLATLYGRR